MLGMEDGFSFSNDENYYNWVFWKDGSQNLSGGSREISEKIKQLLEQLRIYTTKKIKHDLVQFWSPEKIGESCFLTTSNQPFAFYVIKEGYDRYRRQSMDRTIYISGGAEEEKPEQLGPVGRAFVNRHAEFSPDVSLYSLQEFQQRDDAILCGLSSIVALPVFETREQGCIGVLEIWSEEYIYFVDSVAGELESCGLTIQNRCYCKGFIDKGLSSEERNEITKVLEAVTEKHPLALALPFIPRFRHEDGSCSLSDFGYLELAIDTKCLEGYSIPPAFHFLHSHDAFYVLKEKGVAGKAFAHRKSYFCRNICDFSISEYPFVHAARKAGLNLSIVICLQSNQSADHNLVLEFLLLPLEDDCYVRAVSLLKSVMKTVKQHLRSFKIVAEDEEVEVVVGVKNAKDSDEVCDLPGTELLVPVDEHVILGNVTHSEVCDLLGTELLVPIDEHVILGNVTHSEVCDLLGTELLVPKDEHVILGNVTNSDHSVAFAEEALKTPNYKLQISHHDLIPNLQKPLKEVAPIFHDSKPTIKRRIRDFGLERPFFAQRRRLSYPSSSQSGKEVAFVSETLNYPVTQDAGVLVIKASYFEGSLIKFTMPRTSKLADLHKQVAGRLSLRVGSFLMLYKDHVSDDIVICNDEDLSFCIEYLTSCGGTTIRMSVKMIN